MKNGPNVTAGKLAPRWSINLASFLIGTMLEYIF